MHSRVNTFWFSAALKKRPNKPELADIINAKNGFHNRSDLKLREVRESFFAANPANEGLGIFFTAAIFFAAFFCAKRKQIRVFTL